MDKTSTPPPDAAEARPEGREPDGAAVEKRYKRPSITRHGNLRLMTQLE